MIHGSPPPVRAFYARRVYLIWGAVWVACFALNAGMDIGRGRVAFSIALGGVVVTLAAIVRYARTPLVEVFDEHVRVRAGIFLPTRSVPFAEIVEVHEPWKHIASLVTRETGERRRVELPLDSLEPAERDDLLALLRASVAARPAAASAESARTEPVACSS